jgi:hypothetical protein
MRIMRIVLLHASGDGDSRFANLTITPVVDGVDIRTA